MCRRGSPARAPSAPGGGQIGGGKVTALSSSGARGEVSGTTVLKTEPERKLSPAEQLETLPWTRPQEKQPDAKALAAERRAAAKAKGYEGEMCSECLNFTLVRN